LEDPDSEEVKEFVEKQVELTESVLASCEERGRLREEITKLYDHPRYDTPFKRGDKYFYFHNTGLQAQKVLYVQVRVSCFSLYFSPLFEGYRGLGDVWM
jgi:prolyl oligopeptidase